MTTRTITEQELQRLKQAGGVKLKRRPGTAPKSPEPVATSEASLSGDKAPEPLAPASIAAPAPDMQPMASMAASMAVRDAQLNDLIENNTKAIKTFSNKLSVMQPEEKSIWQRADFVRHKIKRSKDKLIEYVDSTPMRNAK